MFDVVNDVAKGREIRSCVNLAGVCLVLTLWDGMWLLLAKILVCAEKLKAYM